MDAFQGMNAAMRGGNPYLSEYEEGVLSVVRGICEHWIGDEDALRLKAAISDAIRAEHAQRLTLQHHAADLAQRVADLEAERDEWQRIASAYSPAKELAASLKQATASGGVARKERDELRARLAELGRQEPVATAWMNGAKMVNAFNHPPRSNFDPDGYWVKAGFHELPLYARPVPAIPEDWKLVLVEATEYKA